MFITHSRLKKFSNFDLVNAHFIHPKLIIQEDTQKVRICDLTVRNEEAADSDKVYNFDTKISNSHVHGQLLWVLLRSGEIVIINPATGSQIKVSCEKLANYKIQNLKSNENNVILISKSGECFIVLFSRKELEQDFVNGELEHPVSIERYTGSYSAAESHQLTNGLSAYTEAEALVMKCPITGLYEVMSSNKEVLYMVPWADSLIISDGATMWLVDVRDSQIMFEFKEDGTTYYPLGSFNNDFYYLLWDQTQVYICCAWNESLLLNSTSGDQQDNNSSIQKLSSQETLKVQLAAIIDGLTSTTDPEQVLPQIQPYFGSIEDLPLLIATSLKLCKLNVEFKPLVYSLQKKVFAATDDSLVQLLCDIMNKIDILEYIEFRVSNLYEDLNIFDLSFVELCITFLSKGDFDLASICWLKYSAVKQTISSNDITGILNAIPHNIKMSALINWLRNFLPPLLDENPFYIDLFVRWVTERVFLLEKSGYWPKIGLKFIDDVSLVLDTSLKTIPLRPISMDDLDMLKTHINNIMELKEKHKINMLLGELSSQSPSEVALIMLRRCYTEDLEPFLQHYLPLYSARNCFEIDDTLRSFIEIEAASSGGNVDGARLKILLNSFRLHTNRLECFLQVLRVLDVPWNPIVLDLAVEAASSGTKDFTTTATDRILAEEIQRELNYAKVKVILKKYKFSLKCTDYKLVLHKLMTAPSIDLNDLKVITSVLTEYTNYGSLLYLNRCLCDCETRAALEYFHELSKKEKKILLKSVMIKYEQIINGSSNNALTERNYVDFLKGSKMLSDLETNTVENMYYLKNSFDTKLSINDMYCENNPDGRDITMNVSDAGMSGCVAQLTRAHPTRQSTLVALLHRSSSNHEVRKLVEALITAESHEGSNTQIASVLANFKDGNNSSVLLECCHVLTEIISCCTEEHIHCVIKYLSMLIALVNANVVVKNLSVAWKFHYIFLPVCSLSTLNDLIDFYVSPYNYLECNSGICQSRGDLIPIRIIVNIAEDIASSGKALTNDLLHVRNKIARQVLNKVVASQELDELLVTILLDLLSKGEEDKMWIIDTLRGQNESLPHAVVTYLSYPVTKRTFATFCLSQSTVSYSPQYTLKTKFNFNVADLALPDINEDTWDTKAVMFYFLKQYPDTSVERLIELCRMLHISVNEGLSFQLIALLTTWELKYKIFNDDIGRSQTHFENDESYLLPTCLKLWESIKNKDFIKDVLNDFWKNGEVTLHGRVVSINPYYYEVYLCIYHLLFGSSVNSEYVREYYLLNFLKNYNRKSAPKQSEFELFSVKGMFPELGYHRLPFHLFMREDMWANLKSEITLETYEHWVPAVALLSLDADLQTARDMICSNALKQTMTSRKKSEGTEAEQKESEPWRLTTREEPLLRAAHRCVKHIANMEWAGACLFYVLQGCARGADQVAAAQLCYQFAQRWNAVQPGNRAVRQMERLHCTLSTRHILHRIEWACEDFVRLSTEPTQLIRALYLHPNFVEKISRHDINRAANEIADKNGINISTIRIEILENILEKSREENKNKACFGLDNKALTTAKYILKATCPKMGAIYLSRIALDDDNDYNKSKKLRALQCLMSIIESDTALKVTNRERDSLWDTLLELLYIVNLEHIDMPWIVATFMSDKVGALHQLLEAVGGNIEGLKITAELARRFGNTQIIQKIIPSLLRAGLHDELVPLLLKISSAPDRTVCEAWRTVLLSPFQQADYPITERQRAKCLNAVNLLPVCPIIRDADLIEIWKNCVRCKCFGIGCLLLPYMTTESRQILSELQKIDRRNLIASLKNLQTETYLVPGAMHVVEIMASRSYGKIQKP